MSAPLSVTSKADHIKNNNTLFRKDFPADFFFGVGSSAFQVEGATDEGGRGKSIWDTFCYKKAVESNDEGWLKFKKGCDHYHQFETDVRIMKKLGVKAYRFSISWPRIFPMGTPGKGNLGVNKEGVAFYNNLINALKARDIEPFVTLFHWEVPQALEDKYGGFLSNKIREDFKNFAEFCFVEFGDRVKHWTTVNEPYIFSWGGYALGTLAPGHGYPQTKIKTDEKGNKTTTLAHRNAIGEWNKFFIHILKWLEDHCQLNQEPASKDDVPSPAIEPYAVGHNLILAHTDVVNLYNTKYKSSQRGKIGITLNCDWYEAQDKSSQDDIEAAQRKLDYMLGWFVSPILSGVYPKSMTDFLKERLPSFSDADTKLLANTKLDFIGINYYTAYTAKDAQHLDTPEEQPHFTTDPRVKIFPLGEKSTSSWIYMYAKGIQELLSHINNKYGNNFELYVTENGIDNKGDDPNIDHFSDDMRVKYLQDHIYHIHEAIQRDKVNVKGYFTWSLFDSFEWNSGHFRYGNYYVDYNNNFKRYQKESASWYRFFLQNGLYPNQSIDGALGHEYDQLKENGVEPMAIEEAGQQKQNGAKRKLIDSQGVQQANAIKKPNYGAANNAIIS